MLTEKRYTAAFLGARNILYLDLSSSYTVSMYVGIYSYDLSALLHVIYNTLKILGISGIVTNLLLSWHRLPLLLCLLPRLLKESLDDFNLPPLVSFC